MNRVISADYTVYKLSEAYYEALIREEMLDRNLVRELLNILMGWNLFEEDTIYDLYDINQHVAIILTKDVETELEKHWEEAELDIYILTMEDRTAPCDQGKLHVWDMSDLLEMVKSTGITEKQRIQMNWLFEPKDASYLQRNETRVLFFGKKPVYSERWKVPKPDAKEIKCIPKELQDKTYSLSFGDIVEFGANPEDKLQPIRWKVLDLDMKNRRALLLAEEILDVRPFFLYFQTVTWADTVLKYDTLDKRPLGIGCWLNQEFLQDAFLNPEERERICEVTVHPDINPYYPQSRQGKACVSHLFLLSVLEKERYLEDGTAVTYGREREVWWWLRSNGFDSKHAACVRNTGTSCKDGMGVDCSLGVRPAFWFALDSQSKMKEWKLYYQQREADHTLYIGKKVTFGQYLQRADGAAEDIQWCVLEVDHDEKKVLLLSEKVLYVRPYSYLLKKAGWNEPDAREKGGTASTLRGFLNTEFLSQAFPTLRENLRICDTTLKNSDGTKSQDKVFLLSADEVCEYLRINEKGYADGRAKASEFANEFRPMKDEMTGYCAWWLRDTKGKQKALYMTCDGKIEERGTNAMDYRIGVRPAIWIWM